MPQTKPRHGRHIASSKTTSCAAQSDRAGKEVENMKLSFNIETTDQNALDMIKLKSLPLFTLVTFVYQVIMTRQSFTPAIMKADTGSLVTWYFVFVTSVTWKFLILSKCGKILRRGIAVILSNEWWTRRMACAK